MHELGILRDYNMRDRCLPEDSIDRVEAKLMTINLDEQKALVVCYSYRVGILRRFLVH